MEKRLKKEKGHREQRHKAVVCTPDGISAAYPTHERLNHPSGLLALGVHFSCFCSLLTKEILLSGTKDFPRFEKCYPSLNESLLENTRAPSPHQVGRCYHRFLPPPITRSTMPLIGNSLETSCAHPPLELEPPIIQHRALLRLRYTPRIAINFASLCPRSSRTVRRNSCDSS